MSIEPLTPEEREEIARYGDDAYGEKGRLEATIKRIEHALMVYGEHDDPCAMTGAPCTCGLTEILETVPEYRALADDDAARGDA